MQAVGVGCKMWSWCYLKPPTCSVHLTKYLYMIDIITSISRYLITMFEYVHTQCHRIIAMLVEKWPLEVDLICLNLQHKTKLRPTPGQISQGFFSESQNVFGWMGCLEVIWSNPSVQAGPCELLAQEGRLSVSLENFQGWRFSGKWFCTTLLLEGFFVGLTWVSWATFFDFCPLLCHVYDIQSRPRIFT